MKRKESITPAHIALRPYLMDGEELRWSGRPSEKKRFLPNIVQIVFGLFTLIFSLTWESMAVLALIGSWGEGSIFVAWLFPVVGSLFVCVTSYNVWNMFFGIPKVMRRMVYGVTDSRVLILYPSRKTMVMKEYQPANLSEIRLEMDNNGLGSLYFASNPEYNNRNLMEPFAYDIAFYSIDDPRHVYDLVTNCR